MKSALFLTPKLPYPPEDGGRIAAWNLARCLRHNGYELDLACFTGSADDVGDHRVPLSEVFRSLTTVTREVSRQYPLDLLRSFLDGRSYFVHKFHSRALERRLEALLEARTYDLTVVDSVFTAVYLTAIRRHPSAGHLMLRLQNLEHEIFDRLARDQGRWFYRYLLKREARKFRAFELDAVRTTADARAISERDAAALRSLTGSPVGVLNAFVDVDRYQPGALDETEERSIVSIGDYAWMPNRNGVFWFYERVWPRIRERFGDARWYIVGRNPTAAIRRLAGDGIEVTGRVEDDTAYFRRAHLFAVPLLEGSGVRIKILLALAMGKSVLSTRVGAEGIHYRGLELHDAADAWVDRAAQVLSRPPAIDLAAVDYARRHHHWRRTFELEGASRA